MVSCRRWEAKYPQHGAGEGVGCSSMGMVQGRVWAVAAWAWCRGGVGCSSMGMVQGRV